ncbi:glycosyltransferase family 4 protein [Tautonia sociabilis]|uniref:Glycosyltransferase n=1 Tax=Tautonia sociabilis TaxID=2080755 RepID=A0A432MJ67_9BACT|nr:glycosyltransferase family 4 protein [Tautonia sociabilis]RUL87267.1 glycosyltransferase [Tautonia sociabilis]
MKALALVDGPDHVCCRYRIRPFGPALARAGWELAIEGIARGTLARRRQLGGAGRYDSVILQRKLLSGWEFDRLRGAARRLVFDFDDAVFWRDSFHPKGQQSRSRWERFARTVRQADAVMAGNDFLAARALLAGASVAAVCRIPTCVDPSAYSIREHGEGDAIRLVWIGSSSTLRGMEARRSLWDRIGREVPGVRLRVICDRKPELGAMPVEFEPWSERTEAAALAGCDAGIAWMPDDLWSRGKCGLKVLQYLAAGLPVVANPVGVHAEMVEPGVSGFLPGSDEAWLDAVSRLAADVSLRRRMGREARARVEREYAVDRWEERVVAAVAGPSATAAARPHLGSVVDAGAMPSGRTGGAAR